MPISSSETSGPEPRVSICVQHHPARAHLLKPLLDRMGGYELVSDPEPDGEPSPLRCYRECLRRTPDWATHRLVIQDDAWPCVGFRELAEQAIAEEPDALIPFFVPALKSAGMARMIAAAAASHRWVDLSGKPFTPAVALSWPVAQIDPFLRFSEGQHYRDRKGDDAVIGNFATSNRVPVLATVPCLVEHPDVVESLIGRKHGAGKIRWRNAVLYDERI